MKTKTLWIDFITHAGQRNWRWKPWFLKSHIIYGDRNKAWLAPHWELGWGCFVFHWTGYDKRKETTKSRFTEHECPAPLMQERMNKLEKRIQVLEKAIRYHKEGVGNTQSMYVDRELWNHVK